MRTLNLPPEGLRITSKPCIVAFVVIEGSGTAVTLVAILFDVQHDARPTGVTNGSTEDVRLTGVANYSIGTARRLA